MPELELELEPAVAVPAVPAVPAVAESVYFQPRWGPTDTGWHWGRSAAVLHFADWHCCR